MIVGDGFVIERWSEFTDDPNCGYYLLQSSPSGHERWFGRIWYIEHKDQWAVDEYTEIFRL